MDRAQKLKGFFVASAAVSGMFSSAAALLLMLVPLSMDSFPSSAAVSGESGAAAFFDAAVLVRVLLASGAVAALSLLGRRTAATLESWFVFKDYEHWKS